jgi:stage II sporulation protein D
LDAERAATSAAVRATRGKVVTHRGELVTTFFFSTSGGRTASAEEVWGSAAPYLVSRRDPFDRVSPYHRWPEPVRVSGRELGEALDLDAPVAGMAVLERSRSPRVARVRVVAADGTAKTVTGAEVQAAAGLRSTWFSVRRLRA